MTKVSESSASRLEKEINRKKLPPEEQTPAMERQQRGSVVFPLQYNLCNTVNPYYDLWLHWHVEFELIHVISGTYNLFLTDHEVHLNKNDLCLIPGRLVHGDAQDKGQALYESIVFDVEMLRVHGYSQDLFINDIINNTITICDKIECTPQNKVFTDISDKLFQTIKAHPKGQELMITGYLMIFFGLLQKEKMFTERKIVPSHKRVRNEQLEQVLSLIRKNYDQDLTLQQMADMAGLSPKYFCRIFREMTEKSPIEYLNWFRVNKACALLRETEEKLPEIAAACGFNDFSYFIKTFRRYKGMTPLKYRNFDPMKNGQVNSIGADISEGKKIKNTLERQ